MPASTDFLQEYQQTEAAYTQGNYEEAAALVYQLVENYPEDPSARLLCGHIYGYGLQQFEVAKEQYLAVLELTEDPELVEQATDAMSEAEQYLADSAAYAVSGDLGSQVDLDDADDLSAAETRLEEDEDQSGIPFAQGDPEEGLGDSETELISSSALDELEELSSSDLMSSPLEADVDLDEVDLSSPQLQGIGMESAEDLDLESLDLLEEDLGLEDLHEDLNIDELPDSGNLGTELLEFSIEDESTAKNPSLQVEELSQNPLLENLTPDEDAIATQLDADPFQLDDEQLSSVGEDQFLQPDLEEDWSANFLEEEDLSLSQQELESPENYPTNPQLEYSEAASEEAFDIDDIMALGDLDDEGSPVESVAEHNPNFQTPQAPEEIERAAPPAVEEDSENLDLDEFNSDLDDIFQSLELTSNFTDSEEIGDRNSTKNPPPPAESFHEAANGKRPIDDPPEEPIEDDLPGNDAEAETLLMEPSGTTEDDFQLDENEGFSLEDLTLEDHDLDEQEDSTSPVVKNASIPSESYRPNGAAVNDAVFDVGEIPDSFGLDAFDDESFGQEEEYSASNGSSRAKMNQFSDDISAPEDFETDSENLDEDDFLDNFDEFDDLGNLPDFEASRMEEAAFLSDSSGFSEEVNSDFVATASSALDRDNSAISNDELFNVPLDQEVVTTFTSQIDDHPEAAVTVEQGPFAFLENKPFKVKFLYTALGSGVATLILVATATNIMTQTAALNQDRELVNSLRSTGWIVTAVAGVTSFLSAWGMGNIAARQMSKASIDLQHQFDAIARNNLKARATVYATDELGQMSAKFNQMAQFIETTTAEAQRKAEEQEEAKENLQRQVIRLLDDVEGAARGDLTVTAEVTADVLGAVADSFNLTIQNLREIVVQVKQAARQVSKGATDSATFAKDVAGDALRQAEELAATLNSVQVLTDAIQRVADSAREAEEVARSAAAVATKGGEAVQMTVAGILKIRETVAETTREVKRLAESSQEISKIVAIISTIASRTNLLALNASIEAARAGESGRGFAIVADEVRQLADRSAKSLKEIEQIVMQIQSQTNSVMMAMEEGNQQVIDGTRLAEQAKRSLDDIIQVTNRIDVLVRSITADTVEQNETARAVAQVMQAVEHSAQETSQEAHRVSNALSNLVGVARDLLTSVERFRVDPSDRK
ncbi:methyl-accepting chemotaxis protein [Capilliphycus salinus ALCB114379]|uniref:methyl-accepting chemotaxis protein n=1 Tax=Capilliphycus salinus TaxID=2768948 RepID=UPI0039A62AD3